MSVTNVDQCGRTQFDANLFCSLMLLPLPLLDKHVQTTHNSIHFYEVENGICTAEKRRYKNDVVAGVAFFFSYRKLHDKM